MRLNHLPDDCLLEVFQRIPLQVQMLSTQLVCRRWRNVHLLICRYSTTLALIAVNYTKVPGEHTFSMKNFSQKHGSLATICCPNYHLKLPEKLYFTAKIINLLKQLFPNLSKLELVHLSDMRQITSALKLLNGFSKQIINLKIFYTLQDYDSDGRAKSGNAGQQVYRLLLDVLNSEKFTILRSLTLSMHSKPFTKGMPAYKGDSALIDLSHLEEIRLLKAPQTLRDFLLSRIVDSPLDFTPLRRLIIGADMILQNYSLQFDVLILQSVAMRCFSQLTHLSIVCHDVKICTFLKDNCQNLIYLHLIQVSNVPLSELILHLGSKMADSLKYFRVDYCLKESIGNFSIWSQANLHQYPIFHSTRTLSLSLKEHYFKSRYLQVVPIREMHSACSVLSHLFPNLSSLIITDKQPASPVDSVDSVEYASNSQQKLLIDSVLNHSQTFTQQEFAQEKARAIAQICSFVDAAQDMSELKAAIRGGKHIQMAIESQSKLNLINRSVSNRNSLSL